MHSGEGAERRPLLPSSGKVGDGEAVQACLAADRVIVKQQEADSSRTGSSDGFLIYGSEFLEDPG